MNAVQRLAEALCNNGAPGVCPAHAEIAKALALDILREQGVEPMLPLVVKMTATDGKAA